MSEIRKYLLWFVILCVLVALLYIFSPGYTPAVLPSGAPRSTATIPIPRPPLSTSTIEILKKSKGFQLLVSYTDGGFEPSNATVKKGDTVRWTNNTYDGLWVAASGKTLYPSVTNGCGSSALDSCVALKPGEFWEFTFNTAGTWGYTNNLDKSKVGVVVVK